ncbi:coiled-coil domain-containing protein 170-like [Macrobrachium rosenbergii]|uniref:coiled-coil domain-containing protein 170-like n=1 Tax=Macrobrachium rosenbergii TaxID=79674 RepID=UPI0034D50CCF
MPRNQQKLEELRSQASDNDFYCGYLEEKVKAHEAERKKLKQLTTKLEDQLRASQREVPVLLARNRELEERNRGNETKRNLAIQKNVHDLEDIVQLLQRENEGLKEELSERERKMASLNNSVISENKNDALVEENKVLSDKIAELADQNGILQSEVAEAKPEEIEFTKVTGRLKLEEDSSSQTEKKQKKKKVRRRGRRFSPNMKNSVAIGRLRKDVFGRLKYSSIESLHALATRVRSQFGLQQTESPLQPSVATTLSVGVEETQLIVSDREVDDQDLVPTLPNIAEIAESFSSKTCDSRVGETASVGMYRGMQEFVMELFLKLEVF